MGGVETQKIVQEPGLAAAELSLPLEEGKIIAT